MAFSWVCYYGVVVTSCLVLGAVSENNALPVVNEHEPPVSGTSGHGTFKENRHDGVTEESSHESKMASHLPESQLHYNGHNPDTEVDDNNLLLDLIRPFTKSLTNHFDILVHTQRIHNISVNYINGNYDRIGHGNLDDNISSLNLTVMNNTLHGDTHYSPKGNRTTFFETRHFDPESGDYRNTEIYGGNLLQYFVNRCLSIATYLDVQWRQTFSYGFWYQSQVDTTPRSTKTAQYQFDSIELSEEEKLRSTIRGQKSSRRRRSGFQNGFALYEETGAHGHIGIFLQHHKFYDVDRRFYTDGDRKAGVPLPEKTFMKQFPSPPLHQLTASIRDACFQGSPECIIAIDKVAMKSDVVREYAEYKAIKNNEGVAGFFSWLLGGKSYNPENAGFWPFKSRLEQFQFRTTASYFMCWYTMKENKWFRQLHMENCDFFDLGSYLSRGDSEKRSGPFECARFLYCPDPCCGAYNGGIIKREGDRKCPFFRDNPCHGYGSSECDLKASDNQHILTLSQNLFNVSCDCSRPGIEQGPGYEWTSRFQICEDIDECTKGAHDCDAKTQVCRNTPGSYFCSCRHGYKKDGSAGTCKPDGIEWITYEHERPTEKEQEKETGMFAAVGAIYNWFGSGGPNNKPGSAVYIISFVVAMVTRNKMFD